MKKIVLRKNSTNFREAVEVETCSIPEPQKSEVLVKNLYLGINASDLAFAAGVPPYGAGSEGVGVVVSVGEGVSSSLVGQNVAYMSGGAFSEYKTVGASMLHHVREASASYLSCMITGMAAKLGFDHCGFLKPNEKVLITAAAGATGHLAVQFAKLAGCHVIGSCSNEEKMKFLERIGCDHVINYAKQDLNTELEKAYPEGIDVVFESVGGKVFEACVDRLALKGRIIMLGYTSEYKDTLVTGNRTSERSAAALAYKLTMKSAGIRGFVLHHYHDEWKKAIKEISEMWEQGKIVCAMDQGTSVTEGGFTGIDAVIDAVEYLYSRKSIGKVFVKVNKDVSL